jgi:hypothetical protein
MIEGRLKMKPWLVLITFAAALLIPACAPPSVQAFQVTPAVITAGQTATLDWKVEGASTVLIDPIGSVAANGTRSVSPAVTTVYTLVAGNSTKTIVLTVNPEPITVSFKMDPAMLISNGVATLSWNVSGATSVNIDQGIGNVLFSGSVTVNPSVTTTYTLTATNISSSVSESVSLVVNPPISVSFTASPAAGYSGQGSVLQWNVTGARTITISPDIGEVPASGSRGVYPSTTTTYSLTATSACCSVTRSVAVLIGNMYPYYPYLYYRFPYFDPWQ